MEAIVAARGATTAYWARRRAARAATLWTLTMAWPGPESKFTMWAQNQKL